MARRVITLKGVPHLDEDGFALEAIIPGQLVKGVAHIQLHSTAGGNAARRFALERDERGQGIDVAYPSGDYVKVGAYAPGDRVYSFLASGHHIAADGFLASAGDGNLRCLASGYVPIARALEAVNAASGDTRIRVEIY